MSLSALNAPQIDPTPIFEFFRGSYGSQLLTAAVAHFNIFGTLAESSMTFEQLQDSLGLAPRPTRVLLTALQAFELVECHDEKYSTTELARQHLVPGCSFDVGDYVGLAAQSPGVLEMVERLRTNRPAGSDDNDGSGVAYIYRDGIQSAMDAEATARHFTMALAGRARNVAPSLAHSVDLGQSQCLLDVGGGTGIYSYAILERFPHLRAIVLDRPEVLRIADEEARKYGATDRVELLPGDMFECEIPNGADVVLLSNILHDWDEPECQRLVQRYADALPAGGRLLVHDVFLDDTLDGPLPIALYSAALFSLTEGRAYSSLEYRCWLEEAGLRVTGPEPTLVHCGVMTGTKAG